MIVDASVAFKWIVFEEQSELAAELARSDSLGAPELIFAEVANALWKRFRRGEMRTTDRLDPVRDLLAWTAPVTQLAPAALDLARELAHPVYDCFYLALAIERGEPLVTADDRFLSACAGTEHARRLVALADWR